MNTRAQTRLRSSAASLALACLGMMSGSALAAGNFAVLHNFTGASDDGAYPGDSLLLSGSNLYGVTEEGGSSRAGTIFQYNTTSSNLNVIYSFQGSPTDGEEPTASLTQDGNVLYGMTSTGGNTTNSLGTIFEYNLNTNTEAVVHNFSGPPDGKDPAGSLTGSGTTLYGTTYYGGSSANSNFSYGTIFSFNTTSNSETVLHTIAPGAGDSSFPVGTMVQSGSTLYGMSFEGGNDVEGFGYGSLFAFNTSSKTQSILHVFTGGTTDGNYPNGSVILSGTNLYGMTPYGGTSQVGIIFDYDLTAKKEKIVYSFGQNGGDGINPLGSLIQSGNILYGTTGGGGAHGDGTVFEYNLATGFESVLYSFNGADGEDPKGSLTLSGSTLYGMTEYGGTHNIGVLFSLSATTLTWNNSGASGNGATWDVGADQNWNNSSSATTYSDGSNVVFNDGNNGHYAITLTGIVSPASVYISNSAGNYTISGPGSINGGGALAKTGTGTLTLSTINGYTGGTNVMGGTLVIAANGALPGNQAVTLAGGNLQLAPNTGGETVSSLTISAGSTLDLTNNHIVINYDNSASPANVDSIIRAYISGDAIFSSQANSSYGIGWADGNDASESAIVAPNSVLVAYALYGDANLDGVVNADDFTILIGNLGKTATSWDKGDFNYDGVVNADDFTALLGNLGKSANGADITLPAADLAAIDAFAAANGLMADVPEPGTLSLLTLGALGILRRRRYTPKHANTHK
jgi:uncharacterized repeat protein (TIGR03803 family)/autotransporter-associated beta strand protein